MLHDIGPVIEPKGLARIKSYVGKLPQPRNFREGAEILRRLFDAQFPKLTGEQWLAAAQRTWKMDGAELVPTYDVRLARTLAELDIERPMPAMWTEFDALSRIPILVIHGANSDILSAETVTAMHARHPTMESIEIPDQGHVPLLDSPDLIRCIAEFVGSCDAERNGAGAERKAPSPQYRGSPQPRGSNRPIQLLPDCSKADFTSAAGLRTGEIGAR